MPMVVEPKSEYYEIGINHGGITQFSRR